MTTTQPQSDTDLTDKENQEIDLLTEKGLTFSVSKQSILRFFGKPQRTFEIKPPYLGTLDFMAKQAVGIKFSEAALEGDPFGESKRLIDQNASRCANIVAIAVLNSYWMIKLFTPVLAKYFLWRITPQKLFQLTFLINKISNLGDFINSIRYLSANRTTSPSRMEKQKEK